MHEIRIMSYSSRKGINSIQKECSRIADTEGDYKGQLSRGIRYKDSVLDSRAAAERWIKENDSGWYDNLAIKYKDGRTVKWLVKIEFHC